MDEVSQSIGQLQGRMDSHEARTARIEAKLDAQDAKLDQLLEGQARQRGGRRMLGLITTGGASVIGAAAAMFVQWITSTRP